MKNKRIAGKKNRWKKKQNRLVPRSDSRKSMFEMHKGMQGTTHAVVSNCIK